MTTRTTDDSLPHDPLPRDPRFDAAWRAASSEEPTPALDAAILAAAHREVGAKPQSLSAQAAMRARRRWWPLAAAATVAVIAIGVVQRAGHDDLVAPPSGSAVVSDVPAQSARSAVESAQSATSAQKSKERAPDTPAPAAREESTQRAAPSPTVPLRKKAEAVASAPAPSEKQQEATANTAAPLPEPFPAATAKSDASAPRDAAATAPVADHARESAVRQRNEGGAASAKLAATPPPAAPAVPTPPSAAPPMPTPPAAPPLLTPPVGSFAESSRFAATSPERPSAAAKTATGGAVMEARIKDRAALPVADWIALIRRLRDEGNVAEAARELAAFRAAHADHEKLLPPDLREWHPTEK